MQQQIFQHPLCHAARWVDYSLGSLIVHLCGWEWPPESRPNIPHGAARESHVQHPWRRPGTASPKFQQKELLMRSESARWDKVWGYWHWSPLINRGRLLNVTQVMSWNGITLTVFNRVVRNSSETVGFRGTTYEDQGVNCWRLKVCPVLWVWSTGQRAVEWWYIGKCIGIDVSVVAKLGV
jgi:hypothetical protein